MTRKSIHATAVGMALMSLLAGAAPAATATELDDDLKTAWESLWDQRGAPRRAVRWAQPPRYRITGVDVDRHRVVVESAIKAVAEASAIDLRPVSPAADDGEAATLEIEIVADTALQDVEPCATQLRVAANGSIEKVTLRMRTGTASRCVHHELMHAMGIAGHPSGKTVLSYLSSRADSLTSLDRIMLASRYSPSMPHGGTPFEAMATLSRDIVRASAAGQPTAEQLDLADRFLRERVAEMEAFASGNGSVPAIVVQSGKASADHIAKARHEMAFYLSLAYQRGTIVDASPVAALRWLQLAAQGGEHVAQLLLARRLRDGLGMPMDRVAAHKWYSASARAGNTVAPRELEALERSMSPGELASARGAAVH